jgi:hypothetical protein
VRDAAFDQPEAFADLCDKALVTLWEPQWADDGWSIRFEEPWRRLMVRLAAARQLTTSRSLVRESSESELVNRLRDAVVAASQSSHVGRIVLEGELRIDTQPAPRRDNAAKAREQLEQLARRYETTRASMASGGARTRAMDEIANEASQLSRQARLSGPEIIADLASERAGDRVVGLAAVQSTGDPSTFEPVLEAARSSKIPFEQYHALRALESLRPGLQPGARRELAALLENAEWRKQLGTDRSRIELAERILKALQFSPE